MAKQKFYVVWQGRTPGLYDSWAECKAQTDGFAGAVFKSFESRAEATTAYNTAKPAYKPRPAGQAAAAKPKTANPLKTRLAGKVVLPSISVDAAWNTASGKMEYQGVDTATQEPIFHQGPFADGTNNVGEFLAIIHALAYCKARNLALPIYTDSKTAMSWVRKQAHGSKLALTPHNGALLDMLARGVQWLKDNPAYPNKILKWETTVWGENPADFGRK